MNILNFNDMLTNDVVSFEQPGTEQTVGRVLSSRDANSHKTGLPLKKRQKVLKALTALKPVSQLNH